MKTKQSYIQKQQKIITSLVTKHFKHYYLTGGTALWFYFKHRFSEDLDFFTQEYDKRGHKKIMDFIQSQTGFSFGLEAVQDNSAFIPMAVYYLDIGRGCGIKIDFIKDYIENKNAVKKGLHSIEDIYIRKIYTAIGIQGKKTSIGKVVAGGRQSAKDCFDLYYLSKNYMLLSDFFLEHFSYDEVERLILWYKHFSRMDLKLELSDLTSGIDVRDILLHLDQEILQNLTDKII